MIEARIDGLDAVLKRIDTVVDNTDEATLNGMLAAADEAAYAMEDRIEEAVTMTGLYRQQIGAGKPGRIETGAMISSIRQDDGTPGRIFYTESADVGVEVGFVNNPPEYTEDQEFYEYSGDVLLATQRAHDVLAADTKPYVNEELSDLVGQSVKGAYQPRRRTFGPRRFS